MIFDIYPRYEVKRTLFLFYVFLEVVQLMVVGFLSVFFLFALFLFLSPLMVDDEDLDFLLFRNGFEVRRGIGFLPQLGRDRFGNLMDEGCWT